LLKDTEELVKDLNRTNDLFKFVRTMRARFQAAGINDTSSTPISSPPAVSVDTTSEGTTNQSRTRSRSKNKDLHAKRGASPLTSVSSTRRSPRFA
uniref:Kinetochore protein SPC25 n=2 Tax=Aegilops tauschii subsp. strangulata TaxID=200361 RepID=A0A453GWR4_AEGTS